MNEFTAPHPNSIEFASQVKRVAEKNDIPTTTANQIALSLLRDGYSEPDMWEELEKWCFIWKGRVK